MTNDAKLGLVAGVAVVLVVAVFFYPKAGAGPAAIPGGPPMTAGRNGPPGQPPAQVASPPGTGAVPMNGWTSGEPRKQPPVSKDPLMWPQN